MGSFARVLVMVAALAIAGTARAQTDPAPAADPRWSDAVEVIIHAPTRVTVHARCPAMWKLSHGDSIVWVMPTLLENVDGSWDASCFKRTLKGANAFFIQSAYVGVDADKTYLPKGQTLKDVVSPETYARFRAAAKRVHEAPGPFETLRPGWAANYFVTAALRMNRIGHETAPDNMAGMARGAHVKIYEVAFYAPPSDLRNIRNQLDAAGEEACLNSVLDRVDYTLDVLPKVIEAWSHSDMATVLNNIPADDARCFPPGKDGTQLYARENMDRWTRALATALNNPGKTVAAIPLPWLLSRDGVLDQLQAKGVTVTAPKCVEE